MVVKLFNPLWFAVMSLIPILVIIFTVRYRDRNMDEKVRMMKRLSVVSMGVYVLYKLYAIFLPEYDTVVWRELPLQLCNLGIFLSYPAHSKRFSFLKPFVVYVGFFGTLAGILMPDSNHTDIPFWDPLSGGFYATHILGLVLIILFVTLKIYKPRLKDIPLVLLEAVVIVFIIHIINVVFRATGLCGEANYCFTLGLPENAIMNLLWSWIPVPYLFMLPLVPVLGILDLLFFGVYTVIDLAAAKKARKLS